MLSVIDPATNITPSDPFVVTKLRADHYESVLTKPTPVSLLDKSVPLPNLTYVHITCDSIYNNLRKTKKNLSAGCDNIPSLFLFHCAESLAEPLKLLW